MQPTETHLFTPTEIWTPSSPDFQFEQQIRQAVTEMNSEEPNQLIASLRKTIKRAGNGVSYAFLNGNNPEEYSDTEALVMFNQFASPADPGALVCADFIRRVAKFAEVRDDQGKLKPVIMLASPAINGSSLNLTREERQAVRSGDLGPAAREMLQAVSGRAIGRVALLGFSQGADMALAGAHIAHEANLDARALAIGDPAAIEARPLPNLVHDFFSASTKDINQAVEATGLDAQKVAYGAGARGIFQFGVSALFPTNVNIMRGLSKSAFEANMQAVLDQGEVNRPVVAYGGDSAIAKPDIIEPALEGLYDKYGESSILSIKIDGANHAWSNQFTLLAKLYMRAIA